MKNLVELYDKYIDDRENLDAVIDYCLSLLAGKTTKNSHFDKILTPIITDKHQYIALVEFIGLLHQKRKEKVVISGTNERKHYGIYYTPYSIARVLANNALNLLPQNANPSLLTFLEPCSGAGIFVIAYLDAIKDKFPRQFKANLPKIINNIYCADIDGEAITLLKKVITHYLKSQYNTAAQLKSGNFFIGDLLFDSSKNPIVKNDPRQIFSQPNGFDIVLTNPPYKLLKANSNKYGKESENNYSIEVKKIITYLKKGKIYKYNEGTLNLYKLFVEEIVENYSNNETKIGLLIPLTLLTDKQSQLLRSRIINSYAVGTLHIIPEKNNFFPEISQAFCFFVLDKTKKSTQIEIKPNIIGESDFDIKPISIKLNNIKDISDGEEIIIEDEIGWNILNKIHKHKKLKHINNLVNLRGELDLTLDKRFIIKTKTEYPLLKGVNIKEFSYSLGNEFVNPEFITKINGKRSYVFNERLVCQQISNIHSSKRLRFAKINKNHILGNSCNFLALSEKKTVFDYEHISLDCLLGILNSILLDWRFRLTSSNNHIGNYELGELPIAILSEQDDTLIKRLVKKLIINPSDSKCLVDLNLAIFRIYKLKINEVRHILNSYKKNNLVTLIGDNLNTYDL